MDWAEKTQGYLKDGPFVCCYIITYAEILKISYTPRKSIFDHPNFLKTFLVTQ